MNRYKCLTHQQVSLNGYVLSPLQEDHVEPIRQWRNEQTDILRQDETLTTQEQKRYFENYVWSELNAKRPKQILFAFKVEQVLIGYGGLVHIQWQDQHAEVSFLLSPQRLSSAESYGLDFSSFLRLLKEVAFSDLGLHRLFTETYDVRPLHIEILEENGFAREGVVRRHKVIDGVPVDSLLHGCLREEWK